MSGLSGRENWMIDPAAHYDRWEGFSRSEFLFQAKTKSLRLFMLSAIPWKGALLKSSSGLAGVAIATIALTLPNFHRDRSNAVQWPLGSSFGPSPGNVARQGAMPCPLWFRFKTPFA